MNTYKIRAYDAAGYELIDEKLTEQFDMKSAKQFAYEYVMNISTVGIVSTIEVINTKTFDTETIIIY